MNLVRAIGLYVAIAGLFLSHGASSAPAAIVYSTPDSVYTQNFNTLTQVLNAQTWSNNSTLPGWYGFLRSGNGSVGAITQYRANSGNITPNIMQSTTLFSYGGNNNDRALGNTTFTYLSNSIGDGIFAVAFDNDATFTMDSFSVTFDGEQWRKGANASAQSLIFSYGFGSTFGSVSSWTSVSSLQFDSPIYNANAATALNGNNSANRVEGITDTVTDLNWQAGSRLWLRWLDVDNQGDDHQLSIDNFQFSASGISAVPEPSSMMLLGIAGVGGLLSRRLRRKRDGSSSIVACH